MKRRLVGMLPGSAACERYGEPQPDKTVWLAGRWSVIFHYSDEAVAQFAQDITSKGGFVSFDVPPQKYVLIPETFLEQSTA